MQEYFIKAKYQNDQNYDDVIYCAFVVSMHDYSEGSDFFIKTDLKTLYSLYSPISKSWFQWRASGFTYI
jgi:hypothetical protein